MDNMKILYLASEVSPFAMAGGLADVTGALPKALKGFNHEIRMMIPKYKFINERKYVLREVIRLRDIPVTINGKTEMANVKSAFLPESKVQIYLIEVGDFFNRPGIYNDPKTKKLYPDNAERFAFFNKAAIETLKILSWQPNIIHCNDWQTAFTPVYLKTLYLNDAFLKGVKSIYTIHNLTSQGEFEPQFAEAVEFDQSQVKEGGMFYKDGKLNLTKGAIHFADFITTVSETYANEIVDSEDAGFGLGPLLEEKGEKFEGILNGVDYAVWDPNTDKLLPNTYNAEDFSGKVENKKALLQRSGLEYKEDVPLIGIISKITEQKGMDLVLEAMDDLLKMDVQIVVHGDGDRSLVEKLIKYNDSHPDKFRMNVTFDDKMAHLIEAGADIFLTASKYEPCGLNQIYSLKYGTVPVVSSVGGLADTVDDLDESTGEGTGIILKELSAAGIVSAIKRATDYFADKEKWNALRAKIMEEDFSWELSARRYLDIYERVLTD